MPIIQSLFCRYGYDNRSRFFLIQASIYLGFISLSAIFSQYWPVALLVLLPLTAANAMTSLRRLHDAKLTQPWTLAPSISFLLIGLIITFTSTSNLYWLLLLPATISAILLTYPSVEPKDYIQGYYGPIDLSQYQQPQTQRVQRIEPSFQTNKNAEQYTHQPNYNDQTTNNINNQASTYDLGEHLRLALLNKKNASISLTVLLVFIVIAVVLTNINSDEQLTETKPAKTQQQAIKTESVIREHLLAMPDNFDLMLTPHRGLIIHWQADQTEQQVLWQIATAAGDKTCQQLTLNNKKSYRTLSVNVENSEDYYASFSPLDTATLVKSLALGSNFKLCGYTFSLKGSQATLGKNKFYRDYIN